VLSEKDAEPYGGDRTGGHREEIMAFTRSNQSFTEGEKVLVRGRLVAEPAVVVSCEGDEVVVAIAPESNRTEDISTFRTWESRRVRDNVLRRYEW
jgi:hypothetical protein